MEGPAFERQARAEAEGMEQEEAEQMLPGSVPESAVGEQDQKLTSKTKKGNFMKPLPKR
jgi:hypothetical protein